MKTVRIPLERIHQKFFVRDGKGLIDDRVEHFAILFEKGEQVEPVSVYRETDKPGDYILGDGRHRYAAAQFCDLKDIEAIVRPATERSDQILEALSANCGGSVPPSPKDLVHTMRLLVEEGLQHKEVMARMIRATGLPGSYIRRVATTVHSQMSTQRLNKAVDAITNGGLTLQGAADRFKVEPDRIRVHMGQKKARGKHMAAGTIGGLARAYDSLTRSLAKKMSAVLEGLKEGTITADEAMAIFIANAKYSRRLPVNADNWIERCGKAKDA